jgi:hypothetical protein
LETGALGAIGLTGENLVQGVIGNGSKSRTGYKGAIEITGDKR